MGGVRKQYPRMTPEQQKLASENHDLIYWYLHKKGLDEADWYDILAWALCRAAQTYIPEYGEFSTLAVKCFVFAVEREMRTINRTKRSRMQTVSMQLLNDNHDHRFYAEPVDEYDFTESILADDVVEQFVRQIAGHCKERDLNIVQKTAQGMNGAELAELYGLTRERVRQILMRLGRLSVKHGCDPRTA